MRVFSGAVLGYLIFGGTAFLLFRITHHQPHAPASTTFEIASIVYGMLFAMLSSYIASFIGGRKDMLAAKIVAIIIAAGAIVSILGTGISWSAVAALVFMAPMALLGGWAYVARLRSQPGKVK